MARLYVAHSTHFDFKTELYIPLKSLAGDKLSLILPHETSNALRNSRQAIETADWVLAEISHPSTGMGIELGWANAAGVAIISCNKQGMTPSRSVALIAKHHFEYLNDVDLIDHLNQILNLEAVY